MPHYWGRFKRSSALAICVRERAVRIERLDDVLTPCKHCARPIAFKRRFLRTLVSPESFRDAASPV